MEDKPQSIVHKIVRLVKRTTSKNGEEDQVVEDPSCIVKIVEEVIKIVEEDSSIQDDTAVSTTNTDIIQ
jgi:hypothetical protein